jgi:hypothetical protein
MSLRPNGFTQIPAETSRVARAAFPTDAWRCAPATRWAHCSPMSSSPNCSRHDPAGVAGAGAGVCRAS